MTLFADLAGERLDAFLARCAEGMSRNSAQKLIEDGCVLRNGKPGKKNDKLNLGDEIIVTLPEPKAVDILPGDTPEILQKRIMEQAEWILLPAAVQTVAKELREK